MKKRYKQRQNPPGVCTNKYWAMWVLFETTIASDAVGFVCVSSHRMFPIYSYVNQWLQDQYTYNRTNKIGLFIYTQ